MYAWKISWHEIMAFKSHSRKGMFSIKVVVVGGSFLAGVSVCGALRRAWMGFGWCCLTSVSRYQATDIYFQVSKGWLDSAGPGTAP